MNVAVLDVGKTNVKFVVFDATGKSLFERQTPNVSINAAPYLHVDAEKIWSFFKAALQEAAKTYDIETIVPTTHGACGVMMKDDGLALPIMDYEFDGMEDIRRRYETLRDPFSRTFSPLLPNGVNVARQFAWGAWKHPHEFAQTTHFITYPGYWVWRLTGKFSSDICSIGSHTDLWWPREERPSHLAQTLGIADRMAEVYPPYDVIGTLKPELANELGVSPSIKVLAGIHDSNASLLPYLGARTTPFTVLSTGTWVVIMAVGHSLSSLDPARDMLANIDANGNPTATAKYMGGREYAVIAGDCKVPPSLDGVQKLISDGVFALPSFSPNGGPYAALQGRYVGKLDPDLRSSLATLYSALMCAKELEFLDVTSGDLIVEGSFGKNPLLCSLIAALRPKQDLLTALDQAGTALGASMLAHWPMTIERVRTEVTKPAALAELAAYYEKWKSMIEAA